MNISDIFALKEKIKNGYEITFDEALDLYNSDYETLRTCANEIREHFMKEDFDICTIINAKCGSCSENCKFCAQSAHYGKNSETFPLLSEDIVLADAKRQKENGIGRYSLVTSGKKLCDEDVDKVCKIVKRIKSEVGIPVCVSHGLLSFENFKKLKDAGVTRVHNNLETAESFFNDVCTTHSYGDKINAIKNARKAGMEVCSGGIFGLGESISQRIELAFKLKELDIRSIPINILSPIKNTPFENNEVLDVKSINRIIATFRFILPKTFIRLAGGRALFGDKGLSAFLSGANATISGDLLTTSGIDTKSDIEMIRELGYKVVYLNN